MKNPPVPQCEVTGRSIKEFFADKFFWSPHVSLSEVVLSIDGVRTSIEGGDFAGDFTGVSDDARILVLAGDVFEDGFTRLSSFQEHYDNWASHYDNHCSSGAYSAEVRLNVTDIRRVHLSALKAAGSADNAIFRNEDGSIDVHACLNAIFMAVATPELQMGSCAISKDDDHSIFPRIFTKE